MQVNSLFPLDPTDVLNQDSSNIKNQICHHDSKSRVWKVVKPILAESIHAAALNLGVLLFFATPITIPLFSLSVVTSLAISCIFAWHDHRQKNGISQESHKHLAITQLVSRGSIVNTVGLSSPNIYIHESGHFLAAKSLFINSNPKILINPYQGGSTIYTASNRLTFLGKIFGKSGSMLVTAAAGLAASTLFVCSELAVAHKIRKTHPNLNQYMNLHAICHLFHEVVYGLTAFAASKKDLGHDLIRLWVKGGIHPIIPISLLIALPLIEIALLKRPRKRIQEIASGFFLV